MTEDCLEIGFVSPWDRDGGLATYSQYLVSELSNHCEVDIIPWDYESLFLRGFGIPVLSPAIASKIRNSDAIHIQYTFGRYLLSFPVIIFLSTLFRTPIIITQHERFDNLPLSDILFFYHQLLYMFVDDIIVHTEDRKNKIWERHHSKVVVIEHGVIHRTNVHRKPREIRTILIPGLIRPIKGHDVAIEALPDIESMNLRIVGGIGDEDYFNNMKKRAEQLGVGEKIEWRTEFIPEEELFQEFRNADAVLLPYEEHTSMSGILSHCISWSIPTLMTDCPAFRDMISNDEVFLEERCGECIAHCLNELRTDFNRQRSIIDSFENLSREHSWENTAKSTVSSYKRIL